MHGGSVQELKKLVEEAFQQGHAVSREERLPWQRLWALQIYG